jgi:hypothetical protein
VVSGGSWILGSLVSLERKPGLAPRRALSRSSERSLMAWGSKRCKAKGLGLGPGAAIKPHGEDRAIFLHNNFVMWIGLLDVSN